MFFRQFAIIILQGKERPKEKERYKGMDLYKVIVYTKYGVNFEFRIYSTIGYIAQYDAKKMMHDIGYYSKDIEKITYERFWR